MSHTNPKPSQDIFKDEILRAKTTEIKERITWRLTDIINSASNIQVVSANLPDSYRRRILLQRAIADLRDVSSKLQEINQYLTQ